MSVTELREVQCRKSIDRQIAQLESLGDVIVKVLQDNGDSVLVRVYDGEDYGDWFQVESSFDMTIAADNVA